MEEKEEEEEEDEPFSVPTKGVKTVSSRLCEPVGCVDAAGPKFTGVEDKF